MIFVLLFHSQKLNLVYKAGLYKLLGTTCSFKLQRVPAMFVDRNVQEIDGGPKKTDCIITGFFSLSYVKAPVAMN